MRSFVTAVALAVIALWPKEAHLSGSSVVAASSRHFRVEIESIRIRFAEPGDEGQWHRDWRAENQPLADRARDRIERALPSLSKQLALAPYSAELPVVHEGNEDEPDAKALVAAKKTFVWQARFDMMSLFLALRTMPSATVRHDVKAAVRAAIDAH